MLAIRLPITPTLLRQMYSFCHLSGHSYDMSLLWAATVTCFFGFFSAGEITAPTASAFDPAVHLAWGDVSVSDDNSMIRVFLKRSKTDQFGRGVAVYLGATGDDLCPFAALSSYIPLYTWGFAWSIFTHGGWCSLDESAIRRPGSRCAVPCWCSPGGLFRPQFPHRCSNDGVPSGNT